MLATLLAAAVLSPQETWKPALRRGGTPSDPVLELSAAESLPNDVVLTVSARLVTEFRRSPGDVSERMDALLTRFEREKVNRTERVFVQGGAWKHELPFAANTLVAGVYEVTLDFDPTAQKPAVTGTLPKEIAPFHRTTYAILFTSKEEFYWAEEIERMHAALTKIGAEFDKVAEAAQKDPVKKSHVNRVLEVVHQHVSQLEPRASCSIVTRTTWQLFDVANQIFRANEASSDSEGPDKDPPAQLGALAAEVLQNARSMFGPEVYLFMRTMLAELRDRTWEAYTHASASGKTGPWTQWKSTYGMVRKGLGRAHERMMGCEEAEFYKERAGDETNPKTSVPWALESLDKLMEACERRINDPKADAPDALLEELNQNLPPKPPTEEPKQP